MGKIILPGETPWYTEQEREHDAWLQKQYDASPEVQKLADRIHSSRLLSGPACPQCIEIALKKLGLPYEEIRTA